MTPSDRARLHMSWHHTVIHFMNGPLFAHNGIMKVFSSYSAAADEANHLNRLFDCTVGSGHQRLAC
jgi:hypothetical protein